MSGVVQACARAALLYAPVFSTFPAPFPLDHVLEIRFPFPLAWKKKYCVMYVFVVTSLTVIM